MTIIKVIKKNSVILKLFRGIELKKIIKTDMMEDSDEYLEKYKTTIQLTIKIIPK